MSTLLAIGYPDETTAAQAAAEAERLSKDLIIEPDAIATIVHDRSGKFRVSTNHHAVGGGREDREVDAAAVAPPQRLDPPEPRRREQSDEIYVRQHIPAANSVLFDVAFANFHRNPTARVDFDKPDRAPLLFVAFAHDHVVPPKVSRHNAQRYDASTGIVAFKVFPGRPHFPGVPGWEDVADFVLAWAAANAMPNGPLTEPAPDSLSSSKGALHVL